MAIKPTTTKIHVTATDNELYILASTLRGSSEICHIKSGFGDPVEYTVVPQSILPPGDYTLIMVGINWGVQAAFSVTLTTGGGDTAPHTFSPAGNQDVGAIWTKAVPITV